MGADLPRVTEAGGMSWAEVMELSGGGMGACDEERGQHKTLKDTIKRSSWTLTDFVRKERNFCLSDVRSPS